ECLRIRSDLFYVVIPCDTPRLQRLGKEDRFTLASVFQETINRSDVRTERIEGTQIIYNGATIHGHRASLRHIGSHASLLTRQEYRSGRTRIRSSLPRLI